MVSFKALLLGAVAIVGVAAQDPTGDEAAAKAAWASSFGNGAGGSAAEKRDVFAKMPRNDPPGVIKDPYKGYWCKAPYTLPPCATKCNRNNCYRGFLNARDGSSGKHCPFEAFDFCCVWNYFPFYYKFIGVKYGLVEAVAPWTASCKEQYWKDTVAQIDDVCGCTLNHEVTLDITANPAYWGLRKWGYHNPNCHS